MIPTIKPTTTSHQLAEVRIKTRFSEDRSTHHRGKVTLYEDGTVTTTNDRRGALHTVRGQELREALRDGLSVDQGVDWFRSLRGVKDCNLLWLPECEALDRLAAAPPLAEYVGRPLLGVGPSLTGKSWLVGKTFDALSGTGDWGRPKSWHLHVGAERVLSGAPGLLFDTRPNRVLQNDTDQAVLCDADGSQFTRFDLVLQLDRWLRERDVLAEGAVLVSKVRYALAFRPVVWTPYWPREEHVEHTVEAMRSFARNNRVEATHTVEDRQLKARRDWDRWWGSSGTWADLKERTQRAGGAAVEVDPRAPLLAQLGVNTSSQSW